MLPCRTVFGSGSANGLATSGTDSLALTACRYRGHRGRDTYLDFEGSVQPPQQDIEDVPFYARCAEFRQPTILYKHRWRNLHERYF